MPKKSLSLDVRSRMPIYGKSTDENPKRVKCSSNSSEKGLVLSRSTTQSPRPRLSLFPLKTAKTSQRSFLLKKTVIDYPEVKDPSKNRPKVHAVDCIPKRKNEVEIRKEIDEYYSKPYVPLNTGKDRKKMVSDLQAKFKKQRGALPKGAELPLYEEQPEEVVEELTEEELRQKAIQKIPKKHLAFTYEKPKDNKDKKGLTKEEGNEELDKLYEDIEQEIEERQNYLEEIAHLDEPKLKEKVKKEIVERVAELQKIIQMLRRQE